jgi:hypothetical protein
LGLSGDENPKKPDDCKKRFLGGANPLLGFSERYLAAAGRVLANAVLNRSTNGFKSIFGDDAIF